MRASILGKIILIEALNSQRPACMKRYLPADGRIEGTNGRDKSYKEFQNLGTDAENTLFQIPTDWFL